MWSGYLTHFLNVRIEQLEKNIRKQQREGQNLKNSLHVRLYVSAVKEMAHARKDPMASEYVLGNTLGLEHRDWRRIKNRLPDRYRLFFKFFSKEKEIFFAWLNDENTLRHEGAKTDCYVYFRRLIESRKIPSDRSTLREVSNPHGILEK